MSQTSYSVNQATAFAGQLGDSVSPIDAFTGMNNSGTAIGIGLAVARNSGNDYGCKVPASSGDVAALMGVVIASQTLEQPQGGGAVSYPANAPLPLLRKGRVWVSVEENVSAGDQAFVRYAAGGGGSALGAFRKSADTSTAASATGMTYLTTALAAGLALLNVNL